MKEWMSWLWKRNVEEGKMKFGQNKEDVLY